MGRGKKQLARRRSEDIGIEEEEEEEEEGPCLALQGSRRRKGRRVIRLFRRCVYYESRVL